MGLNNPPDKGPGPTPALDVYVSEGRGRRQWAVHCRTRGWEAKADTPEAEAGAKKAAASHRCRP